MVLQHTNPYLVNSVGGSDFKTDTLLFHHTTPHSTYLDYATCTAIAVPGGRGGLFKIHENLGIQMHRFLQDNYRCVFTFDRLQNSPNTDPIIPLFCQGTYPSEPETKRMVLQSLYLDYFHDYELRFGFRVVHNGPVATFVLFKNEQLRAFEQAAELWQRHHSFAPRGQILDLLSRWDKNRPNKEKLIIHLLFAEVPPTFHLGNTGNRLAVSLFDQIRISDHPTYALVEAIWKDFLRILFSDQRAR